MKRAPNTQQDHSSRAALSVSEFCRAYGISRALFYVLLRECAGPRVMRVRGRTLVSVKAAEEWQQKSEKVSA